VIFLPTEYRQYLRHEKLLRLAGFLVVEILAPLFLVSVLIFLILKLF
jgi:hypothetical protein